MVHRQTKQKRKQRNKTYITVSGKCFTHKQTLLMQKQPNTNKNVHPSSLHVLTHIHTYSQNYNLQIVTVAFIKQWNSTTKANNLITEKNICNKNLDLRG